MDKNSSRRNNQRNKRYLTKRLLIGAARRAGIVAAKEAMETMGYVVTVQDGWLVRKSADGQTVKMAQKRFKAYKQTDLIFD